VKTHERRGQAVASVHRRTERLANQERGRRQARRAEPLHVAGFGGIHEYAGITRDAWLD
jgi:hypothetical protein